MISFFGIFVYILVVAIAIVWLLFLHNTVAVIIAAFVLILPVLPLLFNRYAMKMLSFELDERSDATDLGYDRPVYVTIKNPTLMPVIALDFVLTTENNFYKNKKEYHYSLPVYPRQTRHEILTEPVFDACGAYKICVEKISAWDFMHLYSAVKKVGAEKNVSILPKKYEGISLRAERFINENIDTNESNKKGSDYPEVRDVREYIPGDSLKNIHWKLSAKKENLMVKEHISLASDTIVVVLELTEDGNFLTERIMRTAYTVLQPWVKSGEVITLWWWSEAENDMHQMNINGMDELDNAFLTLMNEQTYKSPDKARSSFEYADSFATSIVWISGCDGEGVTVLRGGDWLEEEKEKKKEKKLFGRKVKEKEKVAAFVKFVEI
jgi:uncharacterized protein (DUF58 family)